MMLFSTLSIRTKLALLMTLVLAVFAIAVFIYFPVRLRRQAVMALSQKAVTTAAMTANVLSAPMRNNDRVAAAEALAVLRRDLDLVYFLVRKPAGEVFAGYNELAAEESGYSSIVMTAVPSALQLPAHAAPDEARTFAAEMATVAGLSARGDVYQTRSPIRYRGQVLGELITGFSLARVTADMTRSRATVALVTLVAFAIGVIAVFALSTLIIGPLKRIASISEQIADGDLARRADIASADEVGQLARSFNLMLDRLAGAQFELEDLNHTLEQRVEERARELREETTERRRTQVALQKTEEQYRLLFERNLAGVYIATVSGRILDCNEACARLFRFDSKEEFLTQGGVISYMHTRDRQRLMWQLRETGALTNEEVELRGRNGETVWALSNARLIPSPDDATSATLEGILLDISDRKRAEEEMIYKAYHDSLTGLPNRALFLDRMSVALARAERTQQSAAVMFLDLDELKSINDTLGHTTGDELLKSLARRLAGLLRPDDTIARVGGDEFTILLPDIKGEADADIVAKKVLEGVAQPFMVGRDEIHVTTSVGVSVYPTDGTDAETLIDNADGAMYRVKETGGNNYQFCSRGGTRSVGRLMLEQELRAALERDEFVVWYQPQVTITERRLVGVEALVRWNHPERGIVEPAGFVPLAEHTGLITELGEVVLRKSCQQLKDWSRRGFSDIRIGVNVSPRQFYQRDFVGMVERVVAESDIDPSALELEVTESVAVQKSDRTMLILRQMHEMGISIAIDDFGTGQSSLTYLKQFPVDTVKIDRSFVVDLSRHNTNAESIVSAVLLLANQLGLRTIAEGVEDEDQCDFLRSNDCRIIQGYLISKPRPAADIERFFLASVNVASTSG
jgi:diguanylate cyclase (GGDEF)-like protein/PAS domain S-box-containing protein